MLKNTHYGNLLPDLAVLTNVANATACCQSCSAVDGCAWYTHDSAARTCALKRDEGPGRLVNNTLAQYTTGPSGKLYLLSINGSFLGGQR